jgi:hypothetical protein
MKTIGFCTHFSQSDAWAFDFALDLARQRNWQLNICHWLNSPYNLRRDIVYTSLFDKGETQHISPSMLTSLELKLRQYYEPKLCDFTQVGFKLCEGMYQVELSRCFRQNLLDLVVMGYQSASDQEISGEQPIEEFAQNLNYPLVIVGPQKVDQFRLNQSALAFFDEYGIPHDEWELIEPTIVST